MLSNSSILSASAAPVNTNSAVLSPASLSRVSPSPLVIPNQSPRARLLASSNQQRGTYGLDNSRQVFIYLFTHLAKNNKIITEVRHYINKIIIKMCPSELAWKS